MRQDRASPANEVFRGHHYLIFCPRQRNHIPPSQKQKKALSSASTPRYLYQPGSNFRFRRRREWFYCPLLPIHGTARWVGILSCRGFSLCVVSSVFNTTDPEICLTWGRAGRSVIIIVMGQPLRRVCIHMTAIMRQLSTWTSDKLQEERGRAIIKIVYPIPILMCVLSEMKSNFDSV